MNPVIYGARSTTLRVQLKLVVPARPRSIFCHVIALRLAVGGKANGSTGIYSATSSHPSVPALPKSHVSQKIICGLVMLAGIRTAPRHSR